MKKLVNFIKLKIEKRELLEYLIWKLGIQKVLRHQVFSHPIRYLMYKWYSLYLLTVKSKSEKYLHIKFQILRNKKSDIFLHLDKLYKYAQESSSILETGVRGVVSSWAFLYGLNKNRNGIKRYLLNDIDECDVEELVEVAQNLEVSIKYIWQNNLELELDSNYDLIFIDTLHIYGQLKRELEKYSKLSNRYIILHDTTLDGYDGEIIRRNLDIEYYQKFLSMPKSELIKGLMPAINEFLEENTNWIIKEKVEYNNGLTVLMKVDS